MKPSLISIFCLTFAVALSGCASLRADRSAVYAQYDLTLFAYDLGRTHAGFAACPAVTPIWLDAHLESARIALKGQAGSRLPLLNDAFSKGLLEPALYGQRLHIDCECAATLVSESLRHNRGLYRSVAAPKALN